MWKFWDIQKKEHGIERQFITQTTPDVESEFVLQKNIEIDVEETQEENDEDEVKDDEQHLLLIVNIFQKKYWGWCWRGWSWYDWYGSNIAWVELP